MRLSKYKTTTLLALSSIIILMIVNLLFVITINYFLKKEAITEARDKANIILDRNLSVHEYFSMQLKPSLMEILEDTIASGNYFEPLWMSSTYAIRNIDLYFQNRNNYGYYYKDAAINARSPHNEADSLEVKYLKEISGNPNLPEKTGIIEINDTAYYYILKKGEILGAGCLICHDTPKRAPKELVHQYGGVKSFNRNIDDIISVVSIRIPISQAYKSAHQNVLMISLIVSIIIIITMVIFNYVYKKLIADPIKALGKQALAISQDNAKLGETINISTTRDLTEFVDSFNKMSHKLNDYNLSLEDKVRQKTAELEKNISEINKLNVSKDKFFSIVAHDLKGPFNSLIGFSELLINDIEEKDFTNAEDYSKSIYSTSKNTYNLLLNLLEWSRSQSGIINYNPEQISLSESLDEVFDLLNDQAKKKGAHLVSEILPDIKVYADKNMLGTILRNLISNAIKYSHKGGNIIIKALNKIDHIQVSVSDFGVGIHSKDIKRLFKIENSLSSPGTHDEKGTGLGLILCKEFVEKHGGKIWVESEVENISHGSSENEDFKQSGSTFYFTLPLKSEN